MGRLKTYSGQFGLIGGICRADSDCIYIEEPAAFSSTSRWKGSLYILVDPAVEGGRSHQIAREITQQIKKSYYNCSSPSITTCLSRSIQKANEILFQRNLEVSGQEKVTLGLTCAVVRGKELFLAQILPGQAYIIHQGQIQALPLNPSWDPEATTMPMMTRLSTLGWTEDVPIEFFHSALDTGDIFCLCSSNIGRSLGKEEAEQTLLYQQPDDVVEQLYRRIHQQGFKEAHAIVVEMQSALGEAARSPFSLEGLQERSRLIGEGLQAWAGSLSGEFRRLWQHPRRPRPPQPARRPKPKVETPEIVPLARPKPKQPWWKTLPQQARAILTPRARLERPRMHIRSRQEKSRLLPAALIGLTLILILVLIISLVHRESERRQDEVVRDLIEQAEAKITLALQSDNQTEANQILDQAEQLLQQALETGRANLQVELALTNLQEERDRINGVSRFQQLDLLVDISAMSQTLDLADFVGLCQENCALRDVVTVGDSVYFLEEEKGTVYLYTPATNALSPLLWAGQEVKGHPASAIQAIARLERPKDCISGGESEDWLALVDSNRWLYLHREGEWESYALSSESDWSNRAIDLEGYEGNIYVLRGALDQILKYYCNAYELAPASWADDPRHLQIDKSVDMAIDGHIYLLQQDGKVLDLLRGELERTLTYLVYPKTLVPVQIWTAEQSDYIYLADRYAGRIIQLRKEDGERPVLARELRSPNEGELWGLQAIAVREEQGLFYIAAGSGLYRAVAPSFTPDMEPEETPAPTATPLPSP
ncbi:MAG: hypothetical protein JXA37_01230 [Chloroflexia bacterium]|nr:hypothetical protein [Chloroflexia bacterium]